MKLSSLPKVQELLSERKAILKLLPTVLDHTWELVANRRDDDDEGSCTINADIAQQTLESRLERVEDRLKDLGVELDDAPTT